MTVMLLVTEAISAVVSFRSDLTVEGAAEIERFKVALRSLYASKKSEMMLFERCIGTRGANHLHLQVRISC